MDDVRDLIVDPPPYFGRTLKCSFCFDYFEEPVISCELLQCTFCKKCLTQLIFQKDIQGKYTYKECHKCFQVIQNLSTTERERKRWIDSRKLNTTMKQFIDNLNAKCPHCNCVLPFSDISQHLNKFCEVFPVNCEFCDKLVPGLKVQHLFWEHINNCWILCGNCDTQILSKHSDQHLVECNMRLLNCDPCNRAFEKDQLEGHLRTIGHLRKSMADNATRQVNGENGLAQEITIIQRRINFTKLVGKRVTLDFLGGSLILGISLERELYCRLDKKKIANNSICFKITLVSN